MLRFPVTLLYMRLPCWRPLAVQHKNSNFKCKQVFSCMQWYMQYFASTSREPTAIPVYTYCSTSFAFLFAQDIHRSSAAVTLCDTRADFTPALRRTQVLCASPTHGSGRLFRSGKPKPYFAPTATSHDTGMICTRKGARTDDTAI